ncbi:MAG: class C sortase [Ruminococcus sp.]
MKKIILRILGSFLVIVSLLLILYPFISNYLMSLNDASEIMTYDNNIENYEDEVLSQALKDAQEYNSKFFGQVMITDPFDPNYQPVTDAEYEEILNLKGDGMMGYIEIPIIDVNLPIYHGTSSSTLAKGVGHIQNTSLPVGGKGTHSALTGHTAFSSARLFTDINQLVEGDIFYVHVLNNTLAYKIDQKKVVLPSQIDDLKITPDKDYVTLVTCTPYGINTHRLLVRGTRIPYEKAEKEIAEIDRVVESTWMLEYKKALFAGAVFLVCFIATLIVLKIILNKRAKRKEQNSAVKAQDKSENNESPPD